MPKLNAALTGSADYLFCRIDKAVADYRAAHPLARLISLGIGDITQPLAPVAAAALRTAAAEMASPAGVRGCFGRPPMPATPIPPPSPTG